MLSEIEKFCSLAVLAHQFSSVSFRLLCAFLRLRDDSPQPLLRCLALQQSPNTCVPLPFIIMFQSLQEIMIIRCYPYFGFYVIAPPASWNSIIFQSHLRVPYYPYFLKPSMVEDSDKISIASACSLLSLSWKTLTTIVYHTHFNRICVFPTIPIGSQGYFLKANS